MSSLISRPIRPLRIILIVLIVLNLAFIFVNSALPVEKSVAESEAVKDVVLDVVPEHTEVGSFLSTNIRSVAHFAEYAMLGLLFSLYLLLYMKRSPIAVSYLIVSGLLIGFFDETIQIFSGRGPSVSDVWLDFSGYITAVLLTFSVFYIRMLALNRIKDRDNG